jgi:tryptophan synthase alpha subunit
VGFGVANAGDARRLASACDGVIVGSALLARIEHHWPAPDGANKISAFIHELRHGLDETQVADLPNI